MNWLFRRLWPYLGLVALVALSELLISIDQKAGLIAYGLWLLPAIFFSIMYERHKELYVCIIGAPLIRLVSLIIPFNGKLTHLLATYGIFLVITLVYIFSIDSKPAKPAKSWFSWAWILPALLLFLLRLLVAKPAQINLVIAPVILLAALVNISYFNILLQNLSEKAFAAGGTFLSALLFFLLQVNSGHGILFIAFCCFESFLVFYAYRATRSFLLLATMSVLFSLMAVFFPL